MKSISLVALLAAGVVLAGCQSATRFRAAPLPPAPTEPVQTTELPTTAQTQAGADGELRDGIDTGEEIAAATPAPEPVSYGNAEVDAMSGGWTISDSGGSCSLFMSTTAWTGGYRALTRGCASPTLQNVNSWNVIDGKIALKDSEGGEIARLTRTGETQYNGSLAEGGGVSFNR